MVGLDIPANAKINLSLDVLRKREDGYHELRMIMQTLELHDTVRLEPAHAGGISLECANGRIPCGRTNTVWKAAELIMERYGIKSGLKIRIDKRIPIAAGLAGGSADAAAVIRGLNELFSLNLGTDEMRMLGKQIGADVPYCIEGGTELAEGVGERLSPLPDFSGVDIVLVSPEIEVSTAWVYGNLKVSEINDDQRPDTCSIIEALKNRDIRTVAALMKNVLEIVTIPVHGIVDAAKRRLIEEGALGSMMSGSGPAVFGIFPDSDSAAAAYNALVKDGKWKCYLTRTVSGAENKIMQTIRGCADKWLEN